MLDVIDQGPGVGAADRPRIFESFYQGKTAPEGRIKGSGLGPRDRARIRAGAWRPHRAARSRRRPARCALPPVACRWRCPDNARGRATQSRLSPFRRKGEPRAGCGARRRHSALLLGGACMAAAPTVPGSPLHGAVRRSRHHGRAADSPDVEAGAGAGSHSAPAPMPTPASAATAAAGHRAGSTGGTSVNEDGAAGAGAARRLCSAMPSLRAG